MDDLESLFAWYKSPCNTCKTKSKRECGKENCIRFRKWFSMAWERACAEIKESQDTEFIKKGGGERWHTLENILNRL